MRRTALTFLTAAALTLGFVVAAPASVAVDRADYVYGAEHMLTPGDIPSSLGDYVPTFDLEVWPDYDSDITLCDTNSDRVMSVPGTKTAFNGFYWRSDDGEAARVAESVFQFANVKAARNAFTKLQRRAALCTDTIQQTDTVNDVPFTSTTTYSNGTLAAARGVPTVYVNEDLELVDGENVNALDNFSTYSRVEDVIVEVMYRRTPNGALTAEELQGVRTTTRAAIRNWRRSSAPPTGSLSENYGYVVGHVITPGDVPSALGRHSLARPLRMSAETGRIFLCDPGDIQFTDDAETGPYIGITAPRIQVDNSLEGRGARSVTQTMYEFPSKKAARAAFRQMQQQSKRCTGTTSVTDDDPAGDGSVGAVTIRRTYRASTERRVSVARVPSIAIAGSQVVIGPDPGDLSRFRQYSLYTLVGSNVMEVDYSKGSAITAKERRSTRTLAERAIALWQEGS